jgi:uncharacterized protein YcfJ
MNSNAMKRVSTGLAAVALLSVISTQAAAAQYDYARVISAEPIVRMVTVNTPVRECWQDTEYYTVNRPVPGSGASTLVGAIVGGVIGHQFGSGRGNDAATIAGTMIGAAPSATMRPSVVTVLPTARSSIRGRYNAVRPA